MSSASAVFPYGITLREGGTIDIFPVAEVMFQTKEGERLSLFLIIDSGAVISALPKNDALFLGIRVEAGLPISIKGIEGTSVVGWKHRVEMWLGKEKILLPIVFIDNESTPRILGRAGLFGRFTIIFEESKRRSAFIEQKSRESRTINDLLDKLASK